MSGGSWSLRSSWCVSTELESSSSTEINTRVCLVTLHTSPTSSVSVLARCTETTWSQGRGGLCRRNYVLSSALEQKTLFCFKNCCLFTFLGGCMSNCFMFPNIRCQWHLSVWTVRSLLPAIKARDYRWLVETLAHKQGRTSDTYTHPDVVSVHLSAAHNHCLTTRDIPILLWCGQINSNTGLLVAPPHQPRDCVSVSPLPAESTEV